MRWEKLGYTKEVVRMKENIKDFLPLIFNYSER